MAKNENLVKCLQGFRETLEAAMSPDPWTALEAPAVTLLADVCDALQLTPTDRAQVLGADGERQVAALLTERVFL